MDHDAPPDLTLLLPRDVYYHLIHTLCASLPPPITDTQEARAARDNAAIADVASMLPANADEAKLAALYVAASAQAFDSMRLAHEHRADAILAKKCAAQADSMMRQSRGFRSLLMRVQAQRQKREADSTALEKAAWIEHCAIGLMADALGRPQPAPIAEPPPPDAAPTPEEETPPPSDPLAEADQYAIIYPRRAALIRSLGGLPPNCDFGAPAPELVHAIVTGTSPTLHALDNPAAAPTTATA